MSNLIQGYQIAIPLVLSGSSGSFSFDGDQVIVTGSVEAPSFTGSLQGTASWAENTNIYTGSFATTGSNIFKGNQTITGSLITSGTITILYEDAFKNSLYTSGGLFIGYDGGFSNSGYIEIVPKKNNFSGFKITTTESVDSIYRDVNDGNFYIKNIEFGNFSSSMFIEPANGHGLIIRASTSGSNNFTIPVQISGSLNISGSLAVTNGITGSLYGTASWAENIIGLNLSQISTGSVTASVNVGPNGIFLIQSASQAFVEISGSSNTNFYSDLFIVKNFTSKQPVLTISQSIIQVATQSSNPAGTTQAGSIWFTSTNMYIGLD